MEMQGMNTRNKKNRIPPAEGYVHPSTKRAARKKGAAKKGAAKKGGSTGSAKRKRAGKTSMSAPAESADPSNPEHDAPADPEHAAGAEEDEDLANADGLSQQGKPSGGDVVSALLEKERASSHEDDGNKEKQAAANNSNAHDAHPEGNDAASKQGEGMQNEVEFQYENEEAQLTAKVKDELAQEKRESTKKGMTAMKMANMTLQQRVAVLTAVDASFPSTAKKLTVANRQDLRKKVNQMIEREPGLFPKVTKRVGGQQKEYQTNVSYEDFNIWLQKILNFKDAGTIVNLWNLSGVGGPEGNAYQTEKNLTVKIWEKNHANVAKGDKFKQLKADQTRERTEKRQALAAGITNSFFHGRAGKVNIKGADGNAHRQAEASASHATHTVAEDPPGDFAHMQEGEAWGIRPASQPPSLAEALVMMSTQMEAVAKIMMRIDNKVHEEKD